MLSAAGEPPRGAAEAVIGRVAVLAAPRQLRIEWALVGMPGSGEVRVRLRGCGVCASNVPVWEGRSWFEYPRPAGSPGHEGWGVVDAVGPSVPHLQPGDPVALVSYNAFADYELVPARNVVLLPAELEGRDVPGEPLGCAVNVVARSQIQPDQVVAVVGVGFLGALLIQLAARSGAQVVALSRRDFRLDLARRCGAAEAWHAADPKAVQRVQAFCRERPGRRDGCEVVIEATGKQGPLDLASQLVATRGRLVIAGYHQDGRREVDLQRWNWQGIDVINAHERDERLYVQGMERALEAWANGTWNPGTLVTHRFPLEQLDQALRCAANRPEGFLKAVVLNGP